MRTFRVFLKVQQTVINIHMKVNEIISYQRLDEAWYNPAEWFPGAPVRTGIAFIVEDSTTAIPGSQSGLIMPAGSRTAAPAPAPAPSLWQRITGSGKSAPAPSSPSASTAPKTVNGKTAPAGIWNRIKAGRASINQKGISIDDKVTKLLGPWRKLLWILGLVTAIVELWTDLTALEEFYEAGKSKDNKEYNLTAFQEDRQFRIGVFEVAVLTPWLLSKLRIARIVTFVARIIVSIATAGATAATFGAAAVVFMAEQAFFTWFQWWLGSDEGLKWLHENLLMPLVLFGKIGDNAFQQLHKVYDPKSRTYDEKEVDVRKEKGNPDPEAGYTDPAKQWMSHGPGVVINGVQITGADNTLLPNALMDVRVKNAIKNNIDNAVEKMKAVKGFDMSMIQ